MHKEEHKQNIQSEELTIIKRVLYTERHKLNTYTHKHTYIYIHTYNQAFTIRNTYRCINTHRKSNHNITYSLSHTHTHTKRKQSEAYANTRKHKYTYMSIKLNKIPTWAEHYTEENEIVKTNTFKTYTNI